MRGTLAIALVSSLVFSSYAFAQANSPAPVPNQPQQAEQSDGLTAFGQAPPPGLDTTTLLIGGGIVLRGGVLIGVLVNYANRSTSP